MKNILVIALWINFVIANAADTIRAPKFNFSGTEVAWYHRPVKNNKIKQVGTIIKLEQLRQFKSPIIKNGSVFFLLDDGGIFEETGSTLICYNLQTGDSLWQNNYNFKSYGSGLTAWSDFRELGDHVEILGDETKDTTIENWKGFYTGFTSRRIVNADGSDQELFINWNSNDRVNFNASFPPHYLEGNDYAFFYQLGGSRDTLFTDGMYPYIWNDSLVPRYIEKNKILFNEPNSSGLFPFGPAQLDALTYVYFARFYNSKIGKYKHYMWKTNAVGDFKDLKDVSSTIGGPNLNQYILECEAAGNLVRLKIFTPFMPYRQGNIGYLYLDKDGNIVKDQRALQFDGKHVGHIASTNLMDSNQVLHAIRFYKENNIYFYKEYSNGQFVKCGELINNGDPKFAFLPKFITQANTKDIILSFSSSLDSIFYGENFVLGGWPYICKIEAKELGLITNTKKNSDVLLDIFPNPTNRYVTIKGEEIKNINKVIIQDMQGRNQNIEYKNGENGIKLDLDKFNAGVYFLKLINEKDQAIINDKVVKVFKN